MINLSTFPLYSLEMTSKAQENKDNKGIKRTKKRTCLKFYLLVLDMVVAHRYIMLNRLINSDGHVMRWYTRNLKKRYYLYTPLMYFFGKILAVSTMIRSTWTFSLLRNHFCRHERIHFFFPWAYMKSLGDYFM